MAKRLGSGEGWGEKVTVRKVGHGGPRKGVGCGKKLGLVLFGTAATLKNYHDLMSLL